MNLMSENRTLKEEIQSFGKEKERHEKECRCILEENEQLKCQVKELLENLDVLDRDKANNLDNCKGKMESLTNDNKKIMDEMMSLNQENRNLLKTIDDLKSRLNLTMNVTQNEVAELNKTIQDLQDTLQRTKHLQEEEERVKDVEIDRLNTIVSELKRCLRNSEEKDTSKTQEIQHLNRVIKQLVGNLRQIEEKFESVGKVCRICKGRNKVGFSENVKVQTEPDEDQRDLCQQRDDLIKMQSEALSTLEYSVNSICCKETVDELNVALKKRDDVIRVQNETLSAIQQQLETTKHLQQEAELDKEKCLDEIKTLKNSVNELQCALEESSKRALDLQQALLKRDELIILQTETLQKLQTELMNLKELYEDMEKQLGSFKCIESKIGADQQKRSRGIREMRNQFNKLQSKVENITQESANMVASMKEKDEFIESQNKKNFALRRELDSLKAKLSELKSENEKSLDNMLTFQQCTCELADTFQCLESKSACVENALQKRDEIIKLQNDTLSSLQMELDSLKNQKTDDAPNCYGLNKLQQEKDAMIKLQSNLLNELQGQLDSLKVKHSVCESSEQEYLQEIRMLNSSLEKKNQIIKLRNDAVKSLELELRTLRDNECELNKEKTRRLDELQHLKDEFNQLRLMSQDAEGRANNFQGATLSHEAAQEENCRLYEAFLNVQSTNEKLSCQLTTAEQKVLEEYERNKLHVEKISELERLVSEKELDLGRHDLAICSIRDTLKCSLQQNEELHQTIVSLNETIAQLQHAIKKYENDNCKSRENTSQCQSQINSCKKKLEELKCGLDEKTQELCKLEMAYNSQNRCLRSAQSELQEIKEKQNDRQCELKCVVRDLKKQLEKAELNIKELDDEKTKLQQQLGNAARKDAVKDVELKRYRKVVGDLKKTLLDLNRSLTKKNFQCNNAECIKKKGKNETKDLDDMCLNCPCEVEFYQQIVETLKKTVIELKDKLTETQQRNEQLERENNEKEAQQQEKDREYRRLRELLDEKIKKAQLEESRYLELAAQFQKELSCIRRELELKTMQLDDVKKSCQEINSSRCLQLACAQEDVNNLKDELNNLLRKHCTLNVENERLHSQSVRMQNTVSTLEEKSQLLKSQVEQYLSELQIVQTEKEALVQKNRELLSDLRSLQCSYSVAGKQQSSVAENVKSLETELEKVKCSRDEICSESKNVVGYFKDWLQEQKKINKYIMSRERNYCLNLNKMKEGDQRYRPVPPKTCRFNVPTSQPPPRCQSSWSLGSQGTASMHESPCISPCPNEESDWYSSTFRNDSEDEGEEDWVSKVEDLAAQVCRTNRIWKTKMESADYAVCRDPNK
ncbi:unnamed protein product [Acanthoscelides obtectus]|uniref:Uncharacterized protein n=1 Tax=Acanthoscelides obtectus TaxID=200917 RepID=A0A9P0JHZ5_ACAOB|nr:unnamed protein product [Acanthoscelides obtectus]CAK1661340.1 hypothetical protein AOBTE_LOCUS22573 [Acanthoscelides obtectus]